MDIDFARLAIRAGFSAGRELENLIHITKVSWEPGAHREFTLGIARAIAEIQNATMNKAFAAFPELEAEVDAAIAKDGHY
jgi:hypothetical protein